MKQYSGNSFPNYVYGVPLHQGIPDVINVRRFNRLRASAPLASHVHPRDIIQVLYLDKGHQIHVVNRKRFALHGGDALVVRPGDTHSSGGAPEEKNLQYTVSIVLQPHGQHFLGIPGVVGEHLLGSLRQLRTGRFKGTQRLKDHFDSVIRDLLDCENDPLDRSRVLGNLVLLITEILACAQSRGSKRGSAWKRKATAYIDHHVTETLRMRDLAAHMGCTTTWLALRFKKETGVSPAEYTLRRKIYCAKQHIIQNPDRPITEIALDFNFSSSQHFATVFRRFLGYAPSRLRPRWHTRPDSVS